MPIITHKMLADAGQANTARISQADSINGSVAHFFPCTESGVFTEVTDIVGGAIITNTEADVDLADGSTPGTNVSMRAWGTNTALKAGTSWTSANANDYMVIACGKSLADAGVPPYNGYISMYIGTVSTGQFKVHPYYCLLSDSGSAATTQDCATPVYKPLLTRTVGADYIFAGVKRGNTLEHYALGPETGGVPVLTGTRDVGADNPDFLDALNAWTPGASIKLGHAGYGSDIFLCIPDTDNLGPKTGLIDIFYTLDPVNYSCDYTDSNYKRPDGKKEELGNFYPLTPLPVVSQEGPGAGDAAQDYYGILFSIFSNGAPSQQSIKDGIDWMLTEWSAGNKVLYPGWVTYT